jgi:hypothetical protein
VETHATQAKKNAAQLPQETQANSGQNLQPKGMERQMLDNAEMNDICRQM